MQAVQELGCAALAGLAGDPDAQEMLAAKGGPASVLNAMRRYPDVLRIAMIQSEL